MSLRTSENGISLIKKCEGCHLNAYKCPAGIWTIGYGHTSGVYEKQKITQVQAESFLKDDLCKYEQNVNKYYPKYKWTQNEFDALVSFAFNIGSIDKLTAGGTRSREVIADKILEYNKSNGVVLSGLRKRRRLERELFLRDFATTTHTNSTTYEHNYIVNKTYTLQSNMLVRKSPNGVKLLYTNLTTDGKLNAVKQSDGSACLRQGTKVTCKSISKEEDGSIWIKIPSGYVCAVGSKGKIFIK